LALLGPSVPYRERVVDQPAPSTDVIPVVCKRCRVPLLAVLRAEMGPLRPPVRGDRARRRRVERDADFGQLHAHLRAASLLQHVVVELHGEALAGAACVRHRHSTSVLRRRAAAVRQTPWFAGPSLILFLFSFSVRDVWGRGVACIRRGLRNHHGHPMV